MRSRIALLDVVNSTQLADEAVYDGYDVTSAQTLSELEELVKKGAFPVILVAFEMLQPDPQRALRTLRRHTKSRIVVAISESTPRLQLAHRLWSVGAYDYQLMRNAEPDSLRQTLKQAFADMALAELDATEHDELGTLKILQHMSAALGNHKRVDSLLRELQQRLPQLIRFELLQILLFIQDRPRLFVFQRHPLPHSDVWDLATEIVTSYSAARDQPLAMEAVEIMVADPTFVGASPIPLGSAEVVPMMFCGEAIGSLGLKMAATETLGNRDSLMLRLLAHQLAIGLVHADSVERAQAQSLIDPLTGLNNRRYLDSILPEEWERCHRYHLQLSILILDIDRFKQINDVYGHLIGDVALRKVAETIRNVVRGGDAVIRLGGEEFLIVLPETHPSGAAILFERIRIALKTSPVDVGTGLPPVFVALSGGLAAFPMNQVSGPDVLVRLADEALLAAKRDGRDRLCIADGAKLRQASEALGSDGGDDRRRYPRIACSLPATFVPIHDFDREQAIPLSTLNLSATGIAVSDASARIERNSFGILFLDDRRTPHLARVQWVKNRENDRTAGIELIRSSDYLHATHGRIKVSRALVVASRALTLQMAMRCLRANRFEVDALRIDESLPDDFSISSYQMVILGESVLGEPIGQRILADRKAAPKGVQLLIVGEDTNREKALDLITDNDVHHLISQQVRPEQSLFATLNKIVRGEYFGVRRYLLQGADTKQWRVTTSEEKSQALAGISQVAEDVGCHARITDLFVGAVDEMVINALMHVDAPTPVTVECGADGHILAVSVMDERGRLDVEDIYRGLKLAKERTATGLPSGLSSAGLGFRIMLDSLSHVVINIDPEQRTEVIGIVDLGKSLREYRQTAPSLGVFQRRDGG